MNVDTLKKANEITKIISDLKETEDNLSNYKKCLDTNILGIFDKSYYYDKKIPENIMIKTTSFVNELLDETILNIQTEILNLELDFERL